MKRNISGDIRLGKRSLASNLRKRNQQIVGVKLKEHEGSTDDGQGLHSDVKGNIRVLREDIDIDYGIDMRAYMRACVRACVLEHLTREEDAIIF